MDLLPERWPQARTGRLEPPPGPLPAPEAPPRLLLLDRGDPLARAQLTPLGTLLDPREERRLGQLRRQEDRERFLLGRGLLRLLLGPWLGRDPAEVVLGEGPHGKPQLIAPEGPGLAGAPCRPRFNVAHSGDLILLAFHPCREVGVDVEELRPVPGWEGIARRCLPPQVREAIRALPEQRRHAAFLEAWCRLEAGLKARGLGLFGAAPDPREPAPAAPDSGPVVWPVALPEGYVGAAALL
ncbi:MAG: hypothetical protein ER33_12110 [Cyanobium sp. CACIAM 14]|nr:MAG: hypothetical protein ER33_12110 [Cyanobium sp. CACIAM 14]